MSVIAPVNAAALMDSPYAAQINEGFHKLRFARGLEQEFQAEYAERHLMRLRIGFAVAAVLYGLFLLLRLPAETGAAREWGLPLRGAIIGALALPFMASFVRFLRPWLPPLVMAGYAVAGLSLTAIEVLSYRFGIERHYEGLILLAFHLYVFSGLLIRPAVGIGALVLASYALAGLFGGLAGKVWAWQLLFIGLANLIGAVALYSLEWLERDGFLRRRLLGVIATQDGLTGLYNRMAFFQQFERLVRQAAREHQAVGVVLIDIDHFKRYNDRYGHLEGDLCLRSVAQALAGEFRRPLDTLGRYGGEEFIGIFHDIKPQDVRALAEQLRAAVQALKLVNEDSPEGRVTASIGAVALVPRDDESLVDLIKRADTALYEAKERGRNRVVAEVVPATRPVAGRRGPIVTVG